MSILDSIAQRLGYAKTATIPDVPYWLAATANAERFSVPEHWLPSNQLELYQRLSWVAIAVNAVASTAATTTLSVKQMVGEDEKDITNHPFEALLSRPNPLMSRYELLEATFAHHALTGNAYWWLNRTNEKQSPAEVWLIPSNKIRPVPDGRMFLRGYMYDPGDGVEIPLEPWEIVHFRRFHPLNTFVGLSPIESLATVATGDMAMQKWNTNFFDADNAKLPGALAFADPVNDADWERMKEDIKRQHGGTKRNMMMLRNAGKGGVQWVSMAMSQKDMEFLSARNFNKEEIFATFAPGLASTLAINATEANSTAGRATFVEMGVWPRLVAVAEKITNDVLPVYGDNLKAEFDDIRDSDRAMEMAEQEAFSRVHTIDEVRQKYYGATPLGDERGGLLVAEVTAKAAPVALPVPADAPVDDGSSVTDGPQKALKAASIKAHTGVMVAFYMPPEIRAALTEMQGYLPLNSAPVPANELHLTLAYLGDSAQMTGDERDIISSTLEEFASEQPFVSGELSGLGRFNAKTDEGAQPVHVLFNSQTIQDWRKRFLDLLVERGIPAFWMQGYIPHITLGYVSSDAAMPTIHVPPMDVRLDVVSLSWGDERWDYQLQDGGFSKAEEIAKFQRWAGKRKTPDPSKFESSLLSDADKRAILAEMEDGNTGTMPPFLLTNGTPTRKNFLDDSTDGELEKRLEQERKAQRAIARGLNTQKDRVINSLPDSGDDFARWAQQDLEDALSRGVSEAELQDALRRALIQSVDLGVAVAVAQFASIGYGFDWTLANDDARRWAEQHVGTLIRDIDRTTLERTRRAVAAWVENGEPLPRLVEELTPIFGPARAELIASTEVTRAYAEGNRQAYRASGVVTRWQWRTSEDERVCPICGPLADTVVQIDSDFSGFLPDNVRRGAVTMPPAHPRCRCWVVPFVEGG